MFKVIICLTAFISSLIIGYYSSNNNQKNNHVSSGKDTQIFSRGNRINTNNSVLLHPRSKIINQAKSKIYSRSLSEDKKQIQKILNKDEISKNIFTALLAIQFEKEIDGATEVKKEAYKKAKSKSKETLNHIRNVIKHLDINKNSVEKMRLIDIAGSLEGVNKEAGELGQEILMDNVVPKRPDADTATTQEELNLAKSTTFEMFVPLMAHILAISNTEDPEEALEITLSGIEAQPEPFVYERIANSHLQKYPEHRETVDRTIASLQRFTDIETGETLDDDENADINEDDVEYIDESSTKLYQ